jgi:tetratricopeptide (TPR) repeat protein
MKIGWLNYLFEGGGDQMEQALRAFDADWESIRSVHALAVSRTDSDDMAAKFASNFASAGPHILMFRLPPHERIRWMEAALSAARRLQDAVAASTHNAMLATAYSMAGDLRSAVPRLEDSLNEARESQNRQAEAAALGNLAEVRADLGDYQGAMELAREGLALAREMDDKRMEAQACGTLGTNLAEIGELREALRYLKAQRDIARDPEIRDLPSEARALRKLGVFYRELGHPWRAAVLFDAAASIFERLGAWATWQGVLLSHGILCVQHEDYDRALALFDRVLNSAEDTEDEGMQAVALMNKGNVQDVLGHRNLAEDFYRRAIALARDSGARETEGDAFWNLVRVLEGKGSQGEAIACAHEALSAYESVGNPKAETVKAYLDGRSQT